jgi:TetR/AcrR family transcriptional regulator, hemagglutinin/protease regulatory protein
MAAAAKQKQKGRRRLPPEERRAQLLEVALGVFARRGLGSARHAEIAQEAGVAVSTVFLYFPTRDELVRAVLAEVERFYVAHAEGFHHRAEDASQICRQHAFDFVELLDTHRDHCLVWLDWSTAVREEIWPLYQAFSERMIGIVAATIERGQKEGDVASRLDPTALARMFVGSAQMMAQMKLTGAPEDTIRHFTDTVVEATLG